MMLPSTFSTRYDSVCFLEEFLVFSEESGYPPIISDWKLNSVFRFQETPTKELGDHSAGSSSQVSEFSSPVPTASYLNRFTNSESSTDEEGK